MDASGFNPDANPYDDMFGGAVGGDGGLMGAPPPEFAALQRPPAAFQQQPQRHVPHQAPSPPQRQHLQQPPPPQWGGPKPGLGAPLGNSAGSRVFRSLNGPAGGAVGGGGPPSLRFGGGPVPQEAVGPYARAAPVPGWTATNLRIGQLTTASRGFRLEAVVESVDAPRARSGAVRSVLVLFDGQHRVKLTFFDDGNRAQEVEASKTYVFSGALQVKPVTNQAWALRLPGAVNLDLIGSHQTTCVESENQTSQPLARLSDIVQETRPEAAMCVVCGADPEQSGTSASGYQWRRRTVNVTDEDGAVVPLNLWGDRCDDHKWEEMLGSVLLVRTKLGREFQGVCAVEAVGKLFVFDAAKLANPQTEHERKAAQLRAWFDSNAGNLVMPQRRAGGSTVCSTLEKAAAHALHCLIQEEGEGAVYTESEVLDVELVERNDQRLSYDGCPQCRTGVQPDGNDKYVCRRDHQCDEPTKYWRFDVKLSDSTGAIRASCFGEAGEKVMVIARDPRAPGEQDRCPGPGDMEANPAIQKAVLDDLRRGCYLAKLQWTKSAFGGSGERLQAKVVTWERMQGPAFPFTRLANDKSEEGDLRW